MAIVIPFGKDGGLFYDTAGTSSWSIGNKFHGVSECTVTMDKIDANTSRRKYPGWEDTRVGRKRLRLAFDIIGVTEDSVGTEDDELDILRILYFTDIYDSVSGIALYARADIISASPLAGGPMGDFFITKFDRNEPSDDRQSYAVEAVTMLANGTVPSWITTLPS